MINKIFLIICLFVGLIDIANSNETNCDKINIFSVDYMKCKGNLIKNKTISSGKIFIDDTKKYQDNEWTEEKKKINKIKKKVLE